MAVLSVDYSSSTDERPRVRVHFVASNKDCIVGVPERYHKTFRDTLRKLPCDVVGITSAHLMADATQCEFVAFSLPSNGGNATKLLPLPEHALRWLHAHHHLLPSHAGQPETVRLEAVRETVVFVETPTEPYQLDVTSLKAMVYALVHEACK
jgi:hypothetical protein